MATFTNNSNSDEDKTLKARLDFLGCPYTEEMDEAIILNLLTNPGEMRLKVLHWLFSHYDAELADFLEPPAQSGGRSELKIQRLLNAANALCLCSTYDVELIKGNAPLDKQALFINRLLELICFREKTFSLENTLYSRPDMYASNLDMLVTQDGFLRMFDGPGTLLPRDISMEVDSLKMKQGKNKPHSLEELLSLSDKLSDDVQSNQLQLNQLQKQISVQDENKHQEVLMMSHMLCSMLKELRQLSEAFTHCYVSNLSQWCNKSPPELSQLGATMKRVHSSLQGLTESLSHMNEIRQTQTKLNKLVKKDYTVCPLIIDEQTKEISEHFQQCLNILEETLHRSESRFGSGQPSVLSV